jgi:CDP-glucose 4,6-dehydratase
LIENKTFALIMDFNKIFANKKVLITGHTGFKGSWLAYWLNTLNSKVVAMSVDIPTTPSHYELNSDFYISDSRIDINNYEKVLEFIVSEKPDFIFHLAAQPIVLESYENPLKTFNTNAIGSLNIMEALRISNHKCCAVMITSDKCYENIEKTEGYVETDQLGGKDPYSASKGAAEIIFHSYYESYFKQQNSNLRIASARAGNVMGGGDWADRRIVPDCMKSWSRGEVVEIRSPSSTRPWQHVLEPISGYISLAANLYNNISISGESFNFGPSMNDNQTVESLVREMTKSWPGSKYEVIEKNTSHHEAGLLALNCDKAKDILNWNHNLSFSETTQWTSDWYYTYYNSGPAAAMKVTEDQIKNYINLYM